MFFKKKEKDPQKELDKIRELVESNHKMLVSSARARQLKLLIKLIILGSMVYFVYSTYTKITEKFAGVRENVEDKLSVIDRAQEFIENLLPKTEDQTGVSEQ